MYYVIINHTNPTVDVLKDDFGCILKFRDRKWAILAGEGAVKDGECWEYMVVLGSEI